MKERNNFNCKEKKRTMFNCLEKTKVFIIKDILDINNYESIDQRKE